MFAPSFPDKKNRVLNETSQQLLAKISNVIKSDLDEAKALSLDTLDTKIPLVLDIGQHFYQYSGKKMRPITVLLSSRALGYEGASHIKLALILETIHVATLLHDDVVDASTMRRGHASANSIWGNPASVLVGDFLYARTFEMLVEINRMEIFDVMARTVRLVSEGEIMQLVYLRSSQMSEQDYFNTIERKTAAMFKAGAQMGAIITDQPDSVRKQMANYGKNLGIAFQLIDDYLDYAGDTKTIGKKVGDDLGEGKLTLPLIYARNNSALAKQEIIDIAIRQPQATDIDQVCEIITSSGALEYTINLARQFGKRATNSINFLPHTPYRDALFDLADFACSRNY